MARLIAVADGFVVAADPGPEVELLDFCRSRDHILVLDGAAYPVRGDHLALPGGVTEAAAVRVKARFERAAQAHARAVSRRSRFCEV